MGDSTTDARFITPSDLAERWAISRQTLANDRCAGRGLPYIKVGRVVRYRLADVEAHERASLVNHGAA